MKFHFYSDESLVPNIYDDEGERIELPLVATTITTRVGYLPIVTLELRARYLDLTMVDDRGYPMVMFEESDLVHRLNVDSIHYSSEHDPGGGIVTLTIQLVHGDVVTFA